MLSAEDRKRLRKKKYAEPRHVAMRRALRPVVRAGLAVCVRCHEPIEPGEPWDLGHDDRNPHLHSGPEHRWCNRGAPNRNKTSREW